MHPRARSSHSGYIFMLPTGSLERAHSDQTVTPLPPPLSFESGARRTRNPINVVSVTLLSQIRLIRIFFYPHTHKRRNFGKHHRVINLTLSRTACARGADADEGVDKNLSPWQCFLYSAPHKTEWTATSENTHTNKHTRAREKRRWSLTDMSGYWRLHVRCRFKLGGISD